MKVHYFGLYGRAEAMRMILSHAKQPYEDVSYTFESWGGVKNSGKFEFNQLPGLEMDDKIYC